MWVLSTSLLFDIRLLNDIRYSPGQCRRYRGMLAHSTAVLPCRYPRQNNPPERLLWAFAPGPESNYDVSIQSRPSGPTALPHINTGGSRPGTDSIRLQGDIAQGSARARDLRRDPKPGSKRGGPLFGGPICCDRSDRVNYRRCSSPTDSRPRIHCVHCDRTNTRVCLRARGRHGWYRPDPTPW